MELGFQISARTRGKGEPCTGRCTRPHLNTGAGSAPTADANVSATTGRDQYRFRGCTGFDFTSASTVACRGCLVCRVTNRGENQLPRILVATAISARSALVSLPTVRASVLVSRSVRSLPDAEQVAGGGRRELPLIKHVDTVVVLMEDGGSTPPTSTFSPPRSAGFVEGPARRTSRVRCDGNLEPGRGGFFHGQRRVSAQVRKSHESVTNRAAGHCDSVTEIFAVSGVDGHADAGLTLSLFYSAPSSRYQARPDCNPFPTRRIVAATGS